jgi:pyruvate/2-oxoglutarate dehydrogenase complex dihydrolipoamide acyltransferase (E2) component
MTRPRRVEVRPFPADRRLVSGGLRAGRHMAPMHGLLDLDVTEATRRLAAHDPPLSFTAFVVASVARAAAAHPEVHAYRNWRGQLVLHHHVDVSTIVEIATPAGDFPLVHTIRDADIRSVADLSRELSGVKNDPVPDSERRVAKLLPVAGRIPGFLRAMYAVLRKSVRVRDRAGTVVVTAVGMFAGGGGFAVAPLSVMSLQVVVGGITERPWVVDGRVEVRNVLDLTVTIDHNVVDGGPATRFGAELRGLIEGAGASRSPDAP